MLDLEHISVLLTALPSFPLQSNLSAPLTSMTSIVQVKNMSVWLGFLMLLGNGPVMSQRP